MRARPPRDWPLLLAIALLWTGSLALPALAAGGRFFTGFELLLDGWQGMSRGVYAWLANPLFVAALACALLAREVLAALLSTLAAALGGSSVFVESALRARMASVPEIDLRIGFYLWMIALAALCLRALTCVLLSRRRAAAERGPRHSAYSGKSRD